MANNTFICGNCGTTKHRDEIRDQQWIYQNGTEILAMFCDKECADQHKKNITKGK